MLYLAADHRGFELKEKIKAHLTEKGVDFEDCGAKSYDKDDDYPDFAYEAAKKVAEDPQQNRAILLCGSGVGVQVAANKVKGVYCAQVLNKEFAKGVSEHDNTNAIAFGADYIEEEEMMKAIDMFLETPGAVEERHVRRFKKIQEIESNSC